MKKSFVFLALFATSAAWATQPGDTPRPDPTPVPCIHCNNPPAQGGDATAISSPVATGNGYSSSIANPIITNHSGSSAQGGQGGEGGSAVADVTNSFGGDTNKSLVAVFPPPSTAVVPMAQNCIVTKSRAGGLLFNAVHGAESEQYSDPVCVLMVLHARAATPEQREMLFSEILKRLK